jgi:hypothetical protein
MMPDANALRWRRWRRRGACCGRARDRALIERLRSVFG